MHSALKETWTLQGVPAKYWASIDTDDLSMFAGTYTALVTPFRNGSIDESCLESIVRDQVRAGVAGIVPVGTTGESPTLDHEEHGRVIQLAVQAARGRIKVIAGTGGNSTREAINLTKAAEQAGADGSLQVAPYYNKPSQEGLYRHFRSIAESTALPLVLYSIPGRCSIEIGIDTVARLAKDCSNIVGIKEAGGNPDRVSLLRGALGEGFDILSGDDSLTLPFMSVGAQGVISVAANIIPRQVARMVKDFAAGRMQAARRLHAQYFGLFRDLFIETNPVPIKAALAMTGKIREEYRLPLTRLLPGNRAVLKRRLRSCGLVK